MIIIFLQGPFQNDKEDIQIIIFLKISILYQIFIMKPSVNKGQIMIYS